MNVARWSLVPGALVPGLLLLAVACRPTAGPTSCDAPATRIGAIQGPGAASPRAGEEVTALGVVTATFPGAAGLGGFALQDLEPDGDPATSDGVFVASPRAEVAIGDRVRVTGTVAELGGITAIAGGGAPELCGRATVQPRFLPLAATDDLEAVEAMLIAFDQPLHVTDLYDLGRRGRLVAADGGRLWAPTNDALAGAGAQRALPVDDGSVVEPAPAIPVLVDGRPPRVGDRLAGLVGVVLEDDEGFVLHRIGMTGVEVRNARPAEPPAVGGDLRVAAFNVLNYFTTFGTRGADGEEALSRQQAKIVAALEALDADLVALVEIENGGPALGRLVAALNEATDDPYRAAGDPEARTGSDDIRVALIFRPTRLEAVGRVRVLDDPVFRGRPMLAQTFRAGAQIFSAVAAHWKSKGGCDRAEGPDRDQGDGQGCWNDLRVREARRTVDLVAELKRATGDPDVLLLGDLNAYGEEDPLDVLRDAGLVDLVARLVADPAERYSFVYRGRAGRLDHVFATPELAAAVTGAGYWHINADEARALDYRLDNPAELFAPDPFRSSDHDPVLVGLAW